MPKTYRLASIGFAHSHMRDLLLQFATCGDRIEYVAAADVPARRPHTSREPGTRIDGLRDAVERYGFKRYDDYQQLIEENDLDIALVCAENAFHPAICEPLLRKGVHVIMEKPMAATMEGALRIARAAKEGGAKVIVNWPSTWHASVRFAKELCDQGKIGKLFKITYRNADSQGPLSYGQQITDAQKGQEWWHQSDVGGGALLDYCCYGANLSCWFFGEKPTSAFGLKANFDSPYASAEDYASITARFPEAVALLEGSWTTVNTGVPGGPLIFGLEGTMVPSRDGTALEIYKTRHKLEPDEVLVAPPLPQGRENLGQEVLHHLDTGEPLHPTLDLPLNLTAMSLLDAGIRSAASQRLEMVQDQTWCVGEENAAPDCP